MKIPKSNAPDINREHHINHLKTNKIILRKFDENVKYQYELINIIETAKVITKFQLISMIQEAKEDVGNSWLIAKLDTIYQERFAV